MIDVLRILTGAVLAAVSCIVLYVAASAVIDVYTREASKQPTVIRMGPAR